MDYRILKLKDEAEWIRLLSMLPVEQQDVYFTPQYYYLYEQNREGMAQCFVFSENGELALYPFLINSINDLGYELDKLYYDIQGAYGYNGIITSSHEKAFIENFYKAFEQYCIKANIVAAFVRFHPFLDNQTVFFPDTDIIMDRVTVAIDLTKDYSQIWETEYSSANRNMVRKAYRLGYKIQIVEKPSEKNLAAFIELYIANMQKVNAEKYYYFSEEYYKSMFNSLPDNSVLFNVLNLNYEIICSSIFFRSANYFHYHLSGRSINADNSVNNFLIDKAVEYAKANGAKYLHLGGGRSSMENDLLLKFKKSFSKCIIPFFIGKKIYNQEVYDKVVDQWGMQNPEKKEKYKNVLLKYRF
jgi:hypothetical protein